MVTDNSVDNQSTVASGFLGLSFVARRLHLKSDCDGMSVISNATGANGSLLGKTVAHEVSWPSEDQDDDESTVSCSNAFVIQCKDDEMIFVTTNDGKRILKRCRPLRERLMECNKQGAIQILHQPHWTPAHVRRLIEILLHGRTWIENDSSIFQSFQKAAEELSLDIRLTSLINYHDSLTESSTRAFFNLVEEEKYQFKLSTAIKSTHWVSLLDSGVLLMPKCKLLSLKLGWNTDSLEGGDNPSQDRLDKCDNLQSDFSVYGHSNMQAIYSIINLIAPSKKKGNIKKHQTLDDEPDIKIICKIRVGSTKQADLSMVWRTTDCSFTMTPIADQTYLEYFQKAETCHIGYATKSSGLNNSKRYTWQEKDQTESPEATDPSSSSSSDTVCVPKGIIIGESSCSNTSIETAQMASSVSCCNEYVCRTLSGYSFLALRHLLQSITEGEPDMTACLVVRAPTPDTLGRLINATIQTSIARLDFDLRDSIAQGGAIFFACKTTSEIHLMLEYLADYSSSAVVKGDFHLCERRG